MTRKHLTACMKIYFKNKVITFSNVSDSDDTIRDQVDQWLNEVGTIDGNSTMILGNLESECKHVSTKNSLSMLMI